MKEKLKKMYFGSITFVETVISLLSIFLFYKRGIRTQLSKIKNCIITNEVSILANGPSAKEIVCSRRDFLSKTDLLVLNNFANTKEFFEFKPQYYIIVDPSYFNPHFVAHSTELTESNWEQEKLVQQNLKKVDWKMTLIVPASSEARAAKHLYASNPYISVVEFNETKVIGYECIQNWAYRNNLGVPSTYNVVIPAILLMINLGYKTIYVYGMDFSWTKTMDVDIETGQMFLNDRHFYSRDEIRFFGRGGFAAWLLGIYTALKGIERVAKYAISRNVRVVNRTKGSFVDYFDYENPDNL